MLTYTAATSHVAEFSDEEERCDRSLFCTQFAVELDGLIYLQCFHSYFYLDGLWPSYCDKYSFEDLDVIKCVIELCYNSSSTVCVSIPIQG